MDFPKKQQQCLIPRYLLQYLTSLQTNHDDPTAPWGGGGGGTYTAGDGIEISNEDVISIDDTVALKTDIPSLTGYATETWVTNQGYLVQSDLSDYVTSSELITELGNYVTTTDLATELLNYAELDDIPTNTSDLTNDSGFITSSALTGYATETWVTNQGYSTFSGSYNDLTDKPTIPAALSGGTWINIDSNNSINVYNPYISLLDSSNNPRVMISSTSNGTAPTFTAKYCNITPTGFGIVDKTQGSFGGYNPAYTYYRHRNILVNNQWTLSFPTDNGTIATREWVNRKGYLTSVSWNDILSKPTFATVATSGSYNDLTDKPTIPDAVSGTNDGTNWTSLTIGSDTYGLASGSTPANMVTTDTAQNISGVKTFIGNTLAFKNDTNNTSGFKIYNQNDTEIGSLRIATDSLIPSILLSNASSSLVKSYIGFGVQPNGSFNNYKFVMPYTYNTDFQSAGYSTIGETVFPFVFTDGTTNVKANGTGVVDLSSLNLGGSSYTAGTGIDITNDVISIDSTVVALKSDIPTVPTNVSSFTNDAGYITGITSSDVTTALGYTPGTSNFSGNYNDLTNKPTIPDAVSGTNDGTNWTSLTIGSDTYGIPSGGSGSGPTVTKYDTYSYMIYPWSNSRICNIYDGLLGSNEFRIENANSGDILLFDVILKYKTQALSVAPLYTERHLIKMIVPVKSTNTSYDISHYDKAVSYEMFATNTSATNWTTNFMKLTIENITNTSTSTTNRTLIGELSVPQYIGASSSSGTVLICSITHIAF